MDTVREETRRPIEVSLRAAGRYQNIFQEIEVDLVVTDPTGKQLRVPAFWAGEDEFRVRFASAHPGEHRWTSQCSNPSDKGVHGVHGRFLVEHYSGDNPLYVHGRLRASADRRHLVHEDGTPFLWLADTWWMGLARRLAWPELFQECVLDRKEKGFSVIQMVFGGFCDYCASNETWHRQQANEGGWPWVEGWRHINPRFYDFADLKFRYLVDQGILPCMVGMWGFYLPFMGTENVKRHWRYLVARYGAFPVVYCLSGETRMPTYAYHQPGRKEELQALQRKEWTTVARYLKQLDPYGNLLTTHPDWHATVHQQLVEPALLDFQMLQTGHAGYHTIYTSLEELQAALSNGLEVPTLVGESCYENIMGGNHEEIQRFMFYADLLTAGCGHTYGASGIWEMNSKKDPFEGRAHWVWGDIHLEDAIHLPGSRHVGLGRKILMRYPWWRLEPIAAGFDPRRMLGPIGAAIPGELYILYLPASCSHPDTMLSGDSWSQPAKLALDPRHPYDAQFIDPRTGDRIPIGRVQTDAAGSWRPPRRPTMMDYLLVVERAQPGS